MNTSEPSDVFPAALLPPTVAPSSQYVFRNPFASSIHPIAGDKTLSILHQINQSQRPEKRLPTEILLRINKEVQRNTIWEEIRATWSFIPGIYKGHSSLGYFGYGMSPLQGRLNLETKRYLQIERSEPNRLTGLDPMLALLGFSQGIYGTSIEEMYCQISSADLLYRLRCYFPEVTIDSNLDRYKCVWEMLIRHNQTGLILAFTDYKGAASLKVHYDKESKYQRNADSDTKQALEEAFSVDGVRFLNALFETVDGSRQMSFYHPTADADIPTDNERYTAVPSDYGQERCVSDEEIGLDEQNLLGVYDNWYPKKVSPSDISSFRSILQDLKYDIPSRKIDRSNGTTALTSVISSPLLFYRLICKFMLGHTHVSVNQVPPITSVWQIQLVHDTKGASIIFMDDHGLFDIRTDAKAKKAMRDIGALVELLCSDTCAHPYDGVLAGCIA